MDLDAKLLNVKTRHYERITVDAEAFEKRLSQRLTETNHKRVTLRRKLTNALIGVLVPAALIGSIAGFAPVASANVLLSVEQISSKVFSLNYTHPIDGYVVIDGMKMTNAQYKLLFAKANWIKHKHGYQVTMQSHVYGEIQRGQAIEFPNAKDALAASSVSAKIPSYIPTGVSKTQYYAYPGSFNIWYQYANNRQIYMTVLSHSTAKEALDNSRKVIIGNGIATVGYVPALYNNSSNHIEVEKTAVIDYTDSQGIHYRIAATGFSQKQVIKMLESTNIQ